MPPKKVVSVPPNKKKVIPKKVVPTTKKKVVSTSKNSGGVKKTLPTRNKAKKSDSSVSSQKTLVDKVKNIEEVKGEKEKIQNSICII